MSDVGAMDLMSLGDDEMERVLQLSDPTTLGRMKQCCCRLAAMLGQQRLIRRHNVFATFQQFQHDRAGRL